MPILESELNKMHWNKVLDKDDTHTCDELMNLDEGIVGKFLKKHKNSNRKISLWWVKGVNLKMSFMYFKSPCRDAHWKVA